MQMLVCAALLIVGAGLLMQLFFTLFEHTSYEFVMLFLLLIFVSNLLAKITMTYVDAE